MRCVLAGRFDPREHVALAVDGEPTARIVCMLDGRVTSLSAIARAAAVEPGDSPPLLLARAWERLGDDLVALLRGDFALLLFDRAAVCGLLVRDQLGMRPLFLRPEGRALAFASELRDLLALLDRRPQPNPSAVAHWLARVGAPGDATLYEGVIRLAPGNLIRLSSSGWEREQWWAPRYSEPAPLSRAEAVAVVAEAMEGAVDRALVGARTPAVLLSGGFDSGSIAAIAARSHRLGAYSGVFPQAPSVDESARIAAVRRFVGLEGVEAHVRGGSALRGSLEFLDAWGLPSASPNWFVWAPLLARARADGVGELLDGEGGDELFGCSPYLIADLLAHGRLPSAARALRRIPGMGSRPRLRWLVRALIQYGGRGVLPRPLHAALRRARDPSRHVPAWLDARAARSVRAMHDPWQWKRLDGPRWWASLVSALMIAPDAIGAPEQLVREAALAGVELRHPYRDVELAATVLALPPPLAFDSHLDRPLARAAMRGLLPDVVRASDEKPFFNELLADALRGPDRHWLEQLLGDPRAEVGAYVDRDLLRPLVLSPASARLRSPSWALDAWRLVTIECWLRSEAESDFARRLLDSRELGPAPVPSFAAFGSPAAT